jgi:FkbH-like protein
VHLSWLREHDDWEAARQRIGGSEPSEQASLLRDLANSRMDFAQVIKLGRALDRALAAAGGALPGVQGVRLAILGSATTSHLVPGIRVAGLRRGLAIEVYEAPYGMYWQELTDPDSGLFAFRPEALLLALDAHHVAGAAGSTAEGALDLMRRCWGQAREAFHCQILQQTVLPVFPDLLGNNESRLPYLPAAVVARINELLRPAAEAEGVDLIAIDRFSAAEGLQTWHDPAMWHRSKHEVHPRAVERYGEQVARVVAAGRGRSSKCLVLDLDNTLWGGVIGDDGLEGIELGQGSGNGEAFVAFQRYAQQLAERGVILAVCSKNDEANALEPFLKHPEMVLKREQIACFVANWSDKATNLRYIAETLKIGLDSLVFADDNPVERALVRRELPMVAVPEMPEDPALYVQTIAAAGYFEALRVTNEDLARGEQYQANAERERLKETVTDMGGYLESLRMVLTVQPFDRVSLARVTQLINKTNQFNLTTERMTESEVQERMNDPRVVTLQARLSDRFGDNGIIAILIARVTGAEAVIETWLMSCRVLGRKVEEACLNVLVGACAGMNAEHLVGVYKPTEKNGMVREMYRTLGFEPMDEAEGGATRWQLGLGEFVPRSVPMQVEQAGAVIEEAAAVGV